MVLHSVWTFLSFRSSLENYDKKFLRRSALDYSSNLTVGQTHDIEINSKALVDQTTLLEFSASHYND